MSKRQIHVGTSPLTHNIYAGYLKANGREWRDGKQDVTGEACAAVAEHALANGGEIIISANGDPAYELSVKKLRHPTDRGS